MQTVQKNNNQKTIQERDNEPELKKVIVNHLIRICVKCGSHTVKINNLGLYCKDCNSNFKMEAD